MHKEFTTSFWQRAYDSLPAQVRGQYLTQLKAAESWELALGDALQVLSRAKNAVVKLFQTPSRAH
ncbi:MAG TPA: hypothetical protein VFB93_25725 [Burkholderiales bacterium]|nr:hypothetical protein [Burkholderiales bacterium]